MRKVIYLLLVLAIFSFLDAKTKKKECYVFIDVSGSMQGFIGGSYSHLLNNFDEIFVLSSMPLEDCKIKKVGTKITDAVTGETFSCFAQDKSQYRENQTNLVAVADYVRNKMPSTFLLITDSELDVKRDITIEESCRIGYDLTCMRQRFGKLIVKLGYSLIVVGFKSKYSGNLYPATGGVIVLKRPIYKPLYIYIFSKSTYRDKAEKLAAEICNFLEDEQKKDKGVECRAVRISPLIFPKVKIEKRFECQDLYSTNGKLIYAVDRGYFHDDTLKCFFSRANKMKARDEIHLQIPISLISPLFAPLKFHTIILTKPDYAENFLSQSPNIDNKGFSVYFNSDVTREKNGVTVQFDIISGLTEKDISNIHIWRDWSTEDPKSAEYREGRTLYISNFLEFLTKYYLKSIKEREKLIFSAILSFTND